MSGPLGVVVVTYGSPDLLDRFLARITWPARTTVVVVDNLADAASRDAIRDRCTVHGWRFLPMAGNVGFGPAVNRGAEAVAAAGCTTLLVLNPDAAPAPGAVEALRRVCDDDPAVLVAPELDNGAHREPTRGLTVSVRWGRALPATGFDGSRPHSWLSGAVLMTSTDLWRRMDGFDERYFLYWEDVDLGARCRRAGGRLVLRADLTAEHAVGATQSGAGKSAVYVRFNCRNRLLYGATHLGRRDLLRWVLATPWESTRFAVRAVHRGLLTDPTMQWALLRGTAAGLGFAVRALVTPRRARSAG